MTEQQTIPASLILWVVCFCSRNIFHTPLGDGIEDWQQISSLFRQGILHPGRDLIILLPVHQTVHLQLLQRVGEHSIGDRFKHLFQFSKPHGRLDTQLVDDLELPFPLEYLNHWCDRAVSVFSQDNAAHPFLKFLIGHGLIHNAALSLSVWFFVPSTNNLRTCTVISSKYNNYIDIKMGCQ